MPRRAGRVPGRRQSVDRRQQVERTIPTTLRLRIESIAGGGDGIGRIESLVCFVPRTARGDLIDAAVHVRNRFGRGEILSVIEPSDERVEPRCRHYTRDKCGGCQLQHVNADAQRNARSLIVRDALTRLARRPVDAPLVEQGPRDWEYRRRLTLTLKPSRGLSEAADAWIGGLHPYDDPDAVFDLVECPITEPALVHAWHSVRAHTPGLPASDMLRLSLRLLDDGRVAVVVQGASAWPASREWAHAVRVSNTDIAHVWWEPESGERLLLATSDEALDDHTAADALAFVQVNSAVAAQLRQHVFNRIAALKPAHVIDAYSGSGLLTEQLARAELRVSAIELDATATSRARERVHDIDADRVQVITAPVEAVIARVLDADPADCVIVNPPRRGLEDSIPVVLEAARLRGLRHVVYISCDPATLARDLGRLPSFRITSLRCFDMFPQTAHVETVCTLEAEAA